MIETCSRALWTAKSDRILPPRPRPGRTLGRLRLSVTGRRGRAPGGSEDSLEDVALFELDHLAEDQLLQAARRQVVNLDLNGNREHYKTSYQGKI